MNYISLPYFYYNHQFIARIKDICCFSNQHLLNFNCEIEFGYGSFPYCYWNGDINNINPQEDKLFLYDDLVQFNQERAYPLILDCSNKLLTQLDLPDVHQNVVFNIFDGCGNGVILSGDDLILNYIKEKYPFYSRILSDNYFKDIKSAKEINNILINNNYNFIILPTKYILYDDILKNIKDKSKCFIKIGNKCGTCEKYCFEEEQQHQFMFSNKSIFASCDNIKVPTAINLKKEIEIFNTFGFNHFIIDTPQLFKLEDFNNEIIKLIFKPNHIGDFYTWKT